MLFRMAGVVGETKRPAWQNLFCVASVGRTRNLGKLILRLSLGEVQRHIAWHAQRLECVVWRLRQVAVTLRE